MSRQEHRLIPHDLTALTEGNLPEMPSALTIGFAEELLGMPVFPGSVTPLPDYLIPGSSEVRRDVRLWGVKTALALARQALHGETLALADQSAHERTIALTRDAFAPELHLIARQIRGGNKFALSGGYEALRPDDADEPGTVRAQRQTDALNLMSLFMQTIPQPAEGDAKASVVEQCRQILALISSTGSGKTGMEAFLFKTLGVGKPISDTDLRIARGLLVFTNQALGRQFLGKRGNDTFRRFSGITDLGAIWEHSKRTDAALELVSKDSLPEALARGYINPEDYEAVAIDEGHHALAPKLTRALGAIGSRLLLFTATPAREVIRRDIRHQISTAYAEIGNLRADIEDGLLSPVRLLTVMFDGDPVPLAAKHGLTSAQQGRRVFVYCQRMKGDDEERQSVQVANLINKMAGRRIAASIGHHNRSENEKNQDDFFSADGELRVLTTCWSLREGVDGPLDDVIFIGPYYALLPLAQGMGRCFRPGENIATVTELMPRKHTSRDMVSIWQVVGLDRIPEPGFILGPLAKQGDSPSKRSAERAVNHSPDHTLPKLHPDIEAAVTSNRLVRSITLAARFKGEVVSLENRVSSQELANEKNLPLTWLHYTFDKNEIPYVGLRRDSEDGEVFEGYERWYEREALEAYLAKHPLPERATAASMTARQISEALKVSYNCVVRTVKMLDGQKKLPMVNKMQDARNAVRRHHDGPAIELITAEIFKIPRAEKDDVMLAALDEELDGRYATYYVETHPDGFTPTPKHYRSDNGSSGVAAHITTAEAVKIRAAYAAARAIPVAQPGKDYGCDDIARLTGGSDQTVRLRLTPEESALLTPRRLTAKTLRTKDCLPHDVAMGIVERLQTQKMPPHLVPLFMILKRSQRKVEAVRKRLADIPVTYINLPGRLGKVKAYPWRIMQTLEESLGIKNSAQQIDYNKVAHSPRTIDHEDLLYSVDLQAQYMASEHVMRFPKLPIVAAPETPPNAPAALAEQDDPELMKRAAAVHAANPSRSLRRPDHAPLAAERQPQPIQPSSFPRKPAVSMPENYRNLVDYLAAHGVGCQPSLLPAIMRRAGIHATAKKDEHGAYWDTPKNAETLRAAIMQYPPPAANLVPASVIAEQYRQYGITLAHIAHVAKTIRSSLEGLTSIGRLPETNTLVVCYQSGLANQITSYINKLIRTGHLPTLLRMGRYLQ
ncbi:MAG TPA: DEAD/DEAH box helicase family protein [Candidatus Saccharimonadales bacterium]|nr:DEAD/DEAH box helicase family protein [Candidatus Saccharimonadales bacterium]